MIKSIVCVSENWAIGKNNDLIFNLKQDMKFFSKTTTNNIVVMGENTLLSLPGGKPLKNRINIVLCPEGHVYEGCLCFHTLESLLGYVRTIPTDQDIYVIGGGMMYRSMLPYCDEVLVTKVKEYVPDAQVFFPNLDMDQNFEIISISDTLKEDNKLFNFVTYRRKN